VTFLRKPSKMETSCSRSSPAGRNFRQARSGSLPPAAWRHYSGRRFIAVRAIRRCAILSRNGAKQATSVLITGESGTGKELVARAIHYRGDRPRPR